MTRCERMWSSSTFAGLYGNIHSPLSARWYGWKRAMRARAKPAGVAEKRGSHTAMSPGSRCSTLLRAPVSKCRMRFRMDRAVPSSSGCTRASRFRAGPTPPPAERVGERYVCARRLVRVLARWRLAAT